MLTSPSLSRVPVVFLDRDGVLNRAFVRQGKSRPPAHLGEFELLPGVPGAVRRLADQGLLLIVITNQPDVARGVQTRQRVEAINDRVRALLPVHDVLTCFHDDADGCACRKPLPGLLREAARRWPIDLERSFLIGDRWRDVAAGQAAGCRTVLLETPWSERTRCSPDHCAVDLPAAVEWVLRQSFSEAERCHEAVR